MKKVIPTVLFYVGFAILALYIFLSQTLYEHLSAQLIDFVIGFGIAIMLVGLVFMLINRYSSEGAKQYEIEEKDERNIRIRERAGFITMYAVFGIFAILAFTFLIMGQPVIAYITVGGAALQRIIYEITKLIYKKKM